MVFSCARDDFLLSRKLNGCTAKPLAFYRRGPDELERFMASQHVDGLERLNATLLRGLLRHLLEERPGLRAVSVRTDVDAVRTFCRWCADEGLLPANPAAKLARLKVDAPAPKTVPPEGVARLLADWPERTFLGVRNRLLVLWL